MSDPKQTALDYLNNWRNAQVRITELEAENERLREALEVREIANSDLYAAAVKQLLTMSTVAVDRLEEYAPDIGWDSGYVVAQRYIKQLPKGGEADD